MRLVRRIGALALILTALAAPPFADASPAKVAALQSALLGLRLYHGFVDGIDGPRTRHGIRAFQHRRGLHVDGIAGPETRRALGWRGRHGLGSRVMRSGDKGWDVAAPSITGTARVSSISRKARTQSNGRGCHTGLSPLMPCAFNSKR